MRGQDNHDRFLRKYPHEHRTFFNRPHWTRREFFGLGGTGLTGAFLSERYNRAADLSGAGVTTKNSAQNVIFILCAGAPSHSDTFDLKMVPGITPASFAPDMVKGFYWPVGLLPNLADRLDDITI